MCVHVCVCMWLKRRVCKGERLQVPVRVKEITVDKAVAESEYKAAIGQLRYALNLQQARGKDGDAAAAAAAAAASPAAEAAGAGCSRTAAAAAALAPPAAASAQPPAEACKPESEQTSSAVIVGEAEDSSEDDCVIVEGLGATRDTPQSPAQPRKARPATFTTATPALATPTWETGAGPTPDSAGCSSVAAAPPATALTQPVAPRVKVCDLPSPTRHIVAVSLRPRPLPPPRAASVRWPRLSLKRA